MVTLPKTFSTILIAGFFLCTFYQSVAQTESSEEWLILGPIPVMSGDTENITEEQQKEVFESALIEPATIEEVAAGQTLTVKDEKYKWKKVKAKNQIVDLNEL